MFYGVESMLPMKSKATALLFSFGLYGVIFMYVQVIGLRTWIVILHMRSQNIKLVLVRWLGYIC